MHMYSLSRTFFTVKKFRLSTMKYVSTVCLVFTNTSSVTVASNLYIIAYFFQCISCRLCVLSFVLQSVHSSFQFLKKILFWGGREPKVDQNNLTRAAQPLLMVELVDNVTSSTIVKSHQNINKAFVNEDINDGQG